MASGIPILATRSGGVPEIVSSGESGRLVSDFTPAAFASTITDVLRLPERGRAMAGGAHDSGRQRCDRSVIGQEYSSIYDAVVDLG
jgi:glycosyltransferase involved in cell wall biosynthesis